MQSKAPYDAGSTQMRTGILTASILNPILDLTGKGNGFSCEEELATTTRLQPLRACLSPLFSMILVILPLILPFAATTLIAGYAFVASARSLL